MPSKPVQLPSGSWRSIAYLGRDLDGKQHRKSFTAANKREAFRLACECEALYKDQVVTEENQLTLGDAIDRYIQLKQPVLSPTTIHGYRAVREHCFRGIIQLRLCDLTSTIVQQEISRQSLLKSPKTIRNAFGLLTSVLRQFHPTLRLEVRLPQKKKEEIQIPSLQHIETVISAADERGDHELALAVMLAAQLGLRRSEMCALTFADIRDGSVIVSKAMVQDDAKEWHIKQPKSSAGYRSMPLTTQLAARLAALSGSPTDRIFSCNPNCISNRFNRLQKRLGLPDYRFHDLRHYNASVMISLGIPTMYITRRLGHSSDDMVKRIYGHLIHDKQQEINQQMSDFFK